MPDTNEYIIRGHFITKGYVYFSGTVIPEDDKYYRVEWKWTKEAQQATILDMWGATDVIFSALKKYKFLGMDLSDDTFKMLKVQRRGKQCQE